MLELRKVETTLELATGPVRVLDAIDLHVARGEVVGLVGESGSGKTMTGFSINGLLPPSGRITAGQILLDGQDLLTMTPKEMRRIRGRRIAMIFQDPMMTLNPVLRIDTQMLDALRAHETLDRRAALVRCEAALHDVGIASPAERLRAYPHQLSGGMRQRVAIAIALLHSPDVVIADEPTTALDVTIQGQILALVQRLCREKGTALLWITHDLSVVAGIADRLAVMYAGRIVEHGPVDTLLDHPAHPYTRGLIDSVPASHTPGTLLPQIPGRMPALTELPTGCAFAPRCTRATAACEIRPEMQIDTQAQNDGPADGRALRCHHPLPKVLP
ncbi:ABC transporter ATP-binding protein [Roseicitreum antarcticum]|uniref:ABC transporter ATP-binding protein n=1 Tax=Roseicitreum antarcticum TaxID=564137 RepID=UPI00210D091D|nr:ABC transporter ATP-binding protein [Roseicitreum antarcticum]